MGGHGTDDGVVAIDGGSDTAAGQAGTDALAVVFGHTRPYRVANVTRHEVVLVLVVAANGSGDRRDGRHVLVWGVCGGAVGDTRYIGDLDDVGGASDDGRSDRPGGGLSLATVVGELVILFVIPGVTSLATLPDTEPVDQSRSYKKSDAADNTTGYGADIGA